MPLVSKLLRPDQRVSEIAKQEDGDRAADHVVDDHVGFSSEPLAAAYGEGKQRKGHDRDRDIGYIEHAGPLCFLLTELQMAAPGIKEPCAICIAAAKSVSILYGAFTLMRG
jgi:hypothetical protein